MSDDVTVTVPGKDYAVTKIQGVIWDLVGTFIDLLKPIAPPDEMYAALLSRVSRELRRDFGADKARAILQGFADTQEQAARLDT